MSKNRERKRLVWIGDSLEELKRWPKGVIQDAGAALLAVQDGREPSDWKPMTIIGPGVKEIRLRGDQGQYRILFVAKFAEAVYVLHSFEKKTQKTAQKDINAGVRRYNDLLTLRKDLANDKT